jgi:MoxR-like ATPase
LDRFLMRLRLGYPDQRAERVLLERGTDRDQVSSVQQCLSLEQVAEFRQQAAAVSASDSLLDYVQRLIAFTRSHDEFHIGLSPRGSLAIMRAARTWALMCGRNHVVPEDVQTILPPVVEHRLRSGADDEGRSGVGLVKRLLNEVDVIA